MPGNRLTPTQKQERIIRLTEAVAAVDGQGRRAGTWVIVEDVLSGDLWHTDSRAEHPGRFTPAPHLGDG